MLISPKLLALGAFGALSQQVLAQNATAISSDGCVSPSTFGTCITAATTRESQCISEAGGNDLLILNCGLDREANDLLCYMSDCWNKVYSCEYQYLASKYLLEYSKDTVPFYPAPDNAPGGCSCNMGKILTNVTATLGLIESKCDNYELSTSPDLLQCQCCVWSATLSPFYGFCPTTDLSQLGINALATQIKGVTTISGTCSNLDYNTCWGDYEIPSADGETYVDPDNLPAGGTESLSTTSGAGYPMTSPPGGATMTVTLLSVTHTVTAAAYNAKNVASGSSATETAVTGTTATGTAATRTGSETGSSSGAAKTGNSGVAQFSVSPLMGISAFLSYCFMAWL